MLTPEERRKCWEEILDEHNTLVQAIKARDEALATVAKLRTDNLVLIKQHEHDYRKT